VEFWSATADIHAIFTIFFHLPKAMLGSIFSTSTIICIFTDRCSESQLELARQTEGAFQGEYGHALSQHMPAPQIHDHHNEGADGVEMHDFTPEHIHGGSIQDTARDSQTSEEVQNEAPSVVSSRETLTRHPRHRNAGRNSTW
jgi:hypothetical protein